MNTVSTLGVDVGSESLVCSFVEAGCDKFSWQSSFKNDQDGFSSILKRTPREAAMVVEPTGNYGLPFVKYAVAAGRTVLMAQPKQAKDYLNSLQSRAKTDKLDSFGLARFGQSRVLKPYPIKSVIVEQLDQLLCARRGLSRSINSLTQQAKELPHAKTELELAITELKTQLQALDKKVTKLAMSDEQMSFIKELMRVHGIGPVTATAALSRLISKKFDTSAQFIAFCGLDVGVIQSGKRKGQSGITKQGDAELRRLFYIAAQSAVNPRTIGSPFRHQYDDLITRGRKHKEAVNIIARKIAKLCWSMVRYQSHYDIARIYHRPQRPIGGDQSAQTALSGGIPNSPANS